MASSVILMMLAYCIACGVNRKENMWPLISLYWAVVTVRYALEALGK